MVRQWCRIVCHKKCFLYTQEVAYISKVSSITSENFPRKELFPRKVPSLYCVSNMTSFYNIVIIKTSQTSITFRESFEMYSMYENVQHLRKASESHEGLPQSWAELHVWHLWKSMWVIISTTPACKKTQEYCLQYVWKVFWFKGRVEWAQKITFKIFLWRVWSNIYSQEWCEKAHAYCSQWRYSVLHVQEVFLWWNRSSCQSKASWDIVLFVIWVSKSVKKHKAKFFQMTSFCSLHHFIHIICHPPEVEF